MSAPGATTLRIDAHRTTLADGARPEVVIPIGSADVADRFFRHDPPTPFELEQAIDAVEDALAAAGLHHDLRGGLATHDLRLHRLLRLPAHGRALARDAVEATFQRLASAALGHPSSLEGLPSGREDAAALLILRECMHHCGYADIRYVDE